MTGDQIASFVAGVLCLLLVGSSLVARRLDWSRTLKLALIWAAIFAAAGFVASFFIGPIGEQRERGSDWVATSAYPPQQPRILHNVYYRT